MSVQVSRQLRQALESLFETYFNGNLSQACSDFGIPKLAFTVDWARTDPTDTNFYRGDRTIESLVSLDVSRFPALAMWIGEGEDQQLEHPRMFSGRVNAHWRFFLFVNGMYTTGLTDLREAVESAMVETLDNEIPSIGFTGIAWSQLPEQQYFDQSESLVGWVQEIVFTGVFEVRA